MKPAGPDMSNKQEKMAKGEVPPPKMDIPPAGKDGVGTVIAST